MIKRPAKRPTNGQQTAVVAPAETQSAPAGAFGFLFQPPARPTHRARSIASIVLALALLGGLAYVIKSAFLSGPPVFPAVIQPAVASELDFQNEGVITGIDVYSGERVRAGQVIATQSTQLEQLRLAYDQAVLAADKQNLAALQSYSAAQSQATQTTSQTQANQRNLNIQLAQEQLAAAETELSAAQNVQQQIQAQAAITEAQTKLALAEASQVSSSPSSVDSAVAASQAEISRDQAQVASDQLLIQQGALTAPEAGIIAAVNGVVGDIAGPDGVISPQSNAAQVPVAPGFQLFPPAVQAPATRASSVYTPLVVMYGGGSWQVVAQVPQAQIESIAAGQSARLSVSGDSRTFLLRVTHIDLDPVVQNGVVSYDVLFTLTGASRGLVSGMAGNVAMGNH